MAYRATTAETQDCPFCSPTVNADIIAGVQHYFPHTRFSRPAPELQILAQRDGFRIRPDVFPAAEGIPHYLATPIEHYLALAHLPKELIPSFTWAVQEIQSRVGVCLMAEHGTGLNQKVMGKSIGHAHGHLFPAQPGLAAFLHQRLRMMPELADTKVVFRDLDDISDLPTFVSDEVKDNPYLLLHDFQHQTVTLFVEEGDVRVPSQLIKRLLAEAKGQPFINWKEMNELQTQAMALRLFATLSLWESQSVSA